MSDDNTTTWHVMGRIPEGLRQVDLFKYIMVTVSSGHVQLELVEYCDHKITATNRVQKKHSAGRAPQHDYAEAMGLNPFRLQSNLH